MDGVTIISLAGSGIHKTNMCIGHVHSVFSMVENWDVCGGTIAHKYFNKNSDVSS